MVGRRLRSKADGPQIGLLSLENPNTSTTLDAKTIERLPNPGQDLTYLAQFAQGALMNTAGSSNDAKAPGGYGNVEFNGLPATSNGYILDGPTIGHEGNLLCEKPRRPIRDDGWLQL